MIYVHADLLEALANEIRCEVAENLIATHTVDSDISDVPAEVGDVVRVSGQLILMGCTYCACTIPQKALEGRLKDLILTHVYPLALSVARGIDQILVNRVVEQLSILDKVHRFPEPNRETCLSILVDAREALNVNMAFLKDRHLLMDADLEKKVLKIPDEEIDLGCSILGFNTWLDPFVPYGLAWHKEAINLVSRPVARAEGLTTFVKVLRDLVGIQVTIEPQENSPDYTLRVETRLGVAVPHPEFTITIGEPEDE